jgi:hypothetical protein
MRTKPLNLLPTQEIAEKENTAKPIVRRKKTPDGKSRGKNIPHTRKLSLTLEDGMIVIRLPVFAAPTKSASGKSMLYGSTRGPRRVMVEVDGQLKPAQLGGGQLKAIASAFVTLEAKKQ